MEYELILWLKGRNLEIKHS